jgi:hypothetical protein
VLLVVVRLRIPQDNAIIAPVILAVSPVAAALICGYRRPRSIAMLAVTTVILTIAIVMGFERLTGISTGLAAPVVIRTAAGVLAALLTHRITRSN